MGAQTFWEAGHITFFLNFSELHNSKKSWIISISNTAQVLNALCKWYIVLRRVARIWKRGGGAILKEWEKCKRPWPEFSLFLNQCHTVFPKIKAAFLGNLGISNILFAQSQMISKKKRSSPILRLIFRPKSEIRTFEGGCF